MAKAIKLVKYGTTKDTFQMEDVEVRAPQNDEVQIEVERFGLNYADVMARNGLYGEAPDLPCILGYEVVGKVVNKGQDVSSIFIGKRVVAFTQFGGYAQRVNTKVYGVAIIDDYDGDKSLCLGTQYVTAYYMSHIATTIFEGDNILIHAAAGGVGTGLIQLLRNKNVNIIGKTSRESKEGYLKDQGVQNVVNYRKKDYAIQVQEILGNKKLDVSFNPVAGATFKKDWNLLGDSGRMLLFGGSSLSPGLLSKLKFAYQMGILIPITTMMQSKSLIGINMLKTAIHHPRVLQKCLEEVVKLAKEGKIDPQVGGVYSAENIVEAHDFLASGESTGKVSLKW